MKSVDCLRIGLHNIRSLPNKLGNMVETLHEFSLDLLLLTETWLFESDTDVILAALPSNYTLIQVPRSSSLTRGGGLALVHKKALSGLKLVPSDPVFSFEVMELVLHMRSQVTHLALVYRPGHPGTDRRFMDEFSMFVEGFSHKSGKLLICGDFNYWVDDPPQKPFSTEFVELVDVNNFVNHITLPTHISGHTLDLLLSPVGSSYIKDVDVCPIDFRVSDHALILFRLDFPAPSSYVKMITYRSYCNLNHDMIGEEIESSLCANNSVGLGASDLVRYYNDFFRSLVDRYCPERTKRLIVRDDSPWYDSSIASLRRQRRHAERTWRRLRTEESRLQYVMARRAVVSRVLTCKVDYYRNQVASCRGDQKKLFTVLNNLLGRKAVAVMPSSPAGFELASAFADFFDTKISHIRAKLDESSLSGSLSVMPVQHFNVVRVLSYFQPVGVEKVLNYIRATKKTFCQLDPINVSKIPLAFEKSATFIAEIINRCFESSEFASTEKVALLHPLLKKVGQNVDNMANYRPVSNLSFLSKLIERAMLEQLLPLFYENNVIPSLQSAYRKHHSTESALCKIYNDLVLNVCEGRSSVLVLLDLSAAFDTIDHKILLEDASRFGVRDSALSLLESYLSDRFQRVVADGAISGQIPLRFGVPQGSVLGPLLFVIYVSSLSSLLSAHGVVYHFYADDTQFYFSIENVDEAKNKIESLLLDIKVWMARRKLKLNDSKTEIIVIRGNSRQTGHNDLENLDVGGTQLLPVDSVRDLGVFFDSSLSFVKHINFLVKNCNYHIRNLYMVKKFLDRPSLLALVHSLVLSRVDYCNSLYVGLPKYLLRKIQSVLNRTARMIFAVPPRTPTTSFLIELHWLPIVARIEFKLCLMTFKAVKYGEPRYLANMLVPLARESNVELRSSDDPFRMDEPRAVGGRSFAARSFSFSAPRLYNRLPIELKSLTSVDSFKEHLKTFLFLRSYNLAMGILNEDYKV